MQNSAQQYAAPFHPALIPSEWAQPEIEPEAESSSAPHPLFVEALCWSQEFRQTSRMSLHGALEPKASRELDESRGPAITRSPPCVVDNSSCLHHLDVQSTALLA